MNGNRAQASIEFLLILAVSLVVITAIVLLAQQQINTVQQQKDVADTQNSLLDIDSAAKEVYAEGEGSKKQIFIQLPSSYQANASSVGNKTIRIRVGGSDYAELENFDVHGALPGTPGGHWIWVISEGSRVRIGTSMISLDRNAIYLMMNANTTATTSFTVTDIWANPINLSTIVTWSGPGVSMSGVPAAFSLNPNAANQITLQFNADEDAGGYYIGEIEIMVSDGLGSNDAVTVPITVQVLPLAKIIIQNVTTPTSPVITAVWQNPMPAYTNWSLMIYANVSDTVNSTVKNCSIDADNANNWAAMTAIGAGYYQPNVTVRYNYTAGFSMGGHSVRLVCADAANYTGPMAFYYFNVSQPDIWGPQVINMLSSPAYPTTLINVTVNATGTDLYTGASNLQSCQVRVDTGGWVNLSVANSSPTASLNYSIGSMSAGRHTVGWQCTDVWGNVGGIYNQTLVVVDVDLILVIDKSYSMVDNVTNLADTSTASVKSTSFSLIKSLAVTVTNGNYANLTSQIRADINGCTASYEARVGATVIASGNRTSTSDVTVVNSNVNLTAYTPPFTIGLYMKANSSSCTVYNDLLSLEQPPSKIVTVQGAATTFMGKVANTTQAGLVTFGSSASTDKTLAVMSPANLAALNSAINAISANQYATCIECGLDYGVTELVSSRARANASKAIILLTDGMSNQGDSVNGAVFARANNVTVYAIGFGSDTNATELTNIALLTYGKYYFAPNAATLQAIFQSIGR